MFSFEAKSVSCSVVETIGNVITVLKRYWKCLGHNKDVQDVRSRIRYLGRRASEHGAGHLYEKFDAAADPSVIQTLENLNRQTRLIVAGSPVKAIGRSERIESPSKKSGDLCCALSLSR